MADDLPYRAEYAKSNRSGCKGCQSSIAKDSLRIAQMVQSRHFDGKQPLWYHFSCFFRKFRPNSVDDVHHFHDMRWEDQEKIRNNIERGGGGFDSGGTTIGIKSLKDFVVQYALSSKSKCRLCEEKIEKEEIRISHKETDPEKPQLGLIDRWHHVGCFKRRRKELGWKDGEFTVNMMTGFKAIDSGDRETLEKLLNKKTKKKPLKAANKEEISVATKKVDTITDNLRKQSQLLWKVKDSLKRSELKKSELVEILEENGQSVPSGIDRIIERVADGMAFGKLPDCPECNGQLVAGNTHYKCHGDISGWTSCTNTQLKVKREAWRIPADLKDDYPYLKKYVYKTRERIFPPMPKPQPLKGKNILLLGKLNKTKDEIKNVVSGLGGSVTTSMAKAYCCISNPEEVEKEDKKMKNAEIQDVFVVSIDFLDECQKIEMPDVALVPLLKKCSIATWGSERCADGKSMKRMMEEEKQSGPSKKVKLIVKSGAAVDPESGMEAETQVFEKNGLKYTATLSMVDLNRGTNSFYKLQLLESSNKKRWHIFRAWGRVGTSIGGTKLESFYSTDNAISQYRELYLEKTGNEFGCKKFVKQPKKFYPLAIDYNEETDKVRSLSEAGLKSKLPLPVQLLVKTIFDIDSMKRAMVEYELDLNKMPLGKLSRDHMQKAYTVLTEASKLIDVGKLTGPKMHDCSNRFYTLIPHDYGFNQPPFLDNIELVKAKTTMLENLMDIEVAYNILKTEVKEEVDEAEDVLDKSYHKLRCDVQPVPTDSDEFKMVEKYAQLTHAVTHDQYKLRIEELFKINRAGEAASFRPFKLLPNHKLLWHGSRTTNYAGILSQGLRIAPPEAPATGYMFGKGIYFADMVSKSANYCSTSASNPCGFVLLADVALGNMMELTDAKDIRKLPKGMHSVKGVGKVEPDPSTHVTLDSGVLVPMGKQVEQDLSKHQGNTSLLYNEYIVYDTAQVNLQYLVKFKFEYKALW